MKQWFVLESMKYSKLQTAHLVDTEWGLFFFFFFNLHEMKTLCGSLSGNLILLFGNIKKDKSLINNGILNSMN